ncbi:MULTISPECIES: bifunctional 4-hydroxy-2-oxoglutarate aldolase/2-dehydro-3-deoxy-phosphogluconate aldolase [Microbacterium]|jgi:2-dehydro-3-deoxyphosphogluconate aldolase/(4S)-4-hydroxy-2-oxoglutarate aldolase|uniref:2-keto-3-deoxy-phosphogluconate aldolase n=1 Tax=Microbacterium paraoxydans TaxID=199592 RepID=A0A1H1RP91_9MICO|nr:MULTISPECIES: bifunctional 4-hydroxy-2-oxoglutarate aldolase/2-dehydro-3-deoxy-phosphogluconate aldolase [Microbacterium]AVL98351.1 2-dehydro-3-deoxyphosphogluconate aldolase [Microbacterium sp. str. 'China']MCK2032949.1 bifunctional 4-hydroxy-2-oxoglutarate aldolase/2-dehydro-3-deoxy-phosphogluconate aldolase [Microbacterium sp. KSW4-4]MCT1365481.1 bifunctional 4-hydroxy-2-oxoglutarate aldolase/2-dehydro-3-deoxy-phosphogluconate aldolase [Microbacterium sp. p3-SID131]MCT1376228.1 bifunction
MSDRLARARTTGILAVLRAPSPELALEASEAIIRGGVSGIEVTFSTPDAPAVIRELIARHGDAAYIGAGTVTTAEQATQAADAGAAFLVSPGTLPDLTRAMLDTGRVVMTGAMTPTEVMGALELGVDVVKIFPASLGGPSYLGALRGPFPDAPLMPTGGVKPDNLADWFAAGAVAVGAGGDLANGAAIANADWADIEQRASRFAAALAATRG